MQQSPCRCSWLRPVYIVSRFESAYYLFPPSNPCAPERLADVPVRCGGMALCSVTLRCQVLSEESWRLHVAVRMGEKVRSRLVSHHLAYTPITCQGQHGHVQPDTPDETCHAPLHCDSCSYHHNEQCPSDIKVLAIICLWPKVCVRSHTDTLRLIICGTGGDDRPLHKVCVTAYHSTEPPSTADAPHHLREVVKTTLPRNNPLRCDKNP